MEIEQSSALFIQARMGSSRLPGKALLVMGGKSILEWVIDNCRGRFARVVVCTSTLTGDDPIAEACARNGVECFRGSEENVFQRFQDAAATMPPEIKGIVRVCADSPFQNSSIIQGVLRQYDGLSDIMSTRLIDSENRVVSRQPKGLAVDYLRKKSLLALDSGSMTAFEREHVIPAFFRPGMRYQLVDSGLVVPFDLAVDTMEDFVRLSAHFVEVRALLNPR